MTELRSFSTDLAAVVGDGPRTSGGGGGLGLGDDCRVSTSPSLSELGGPACFARFLSAAAKDRPPAALGPPGPGPGIV